MKRDWVSYAAIATFVALCALLIGINWYGKQVSNKYQIENNTAHTDASNQRPPLTETIRPHDTPIAGVMNDEPEQDGSGHELNEYLIFGDGWAQWVMAFLAFLGVLVSGYAVYLLKGTLKQGEDINKSGIAAAKAATESNRIMREEQRPWVVFEREVNCEFFDLGHGGQL